MTDYATLQADIADWLARDDVATKTPTFIRLAEAEINRRVRTQDQERNASLVLEEANDWTADLPAGWLGFRRVVTDQANPEAVYVPPTVFHEMKRARADAFGTLGGGPLSYTVEGMSIKGVAGPGAGDPITLSTVYWVRYDPLSDTNTTNWLLANHYDIYLNASLMQAWDYVDETEMVARYSARLDRGIDQLQEQERERYVPAGPKVRRPRASAIY